MTEDPIAIATLPGPWGPYHLAVSARGVVAAEWGIGRDAFETGLRRRRPGWRDADRDAGATLRRLHPAIERVLAGDRVDGSAIPLDVADRPAFDRHVLLAVRDIPWGHTASYGEIARRVGAARAARAVGGAVGRNPIALIVPCHRVIAADGTLGGYGGDGAIERSEALERKRRLLLREGITVAVRSG